MEITRMEITRMDSNSGWENDYCRDDRSGRPSAGWVQSTKSILDSIHENDYRRDARSGRPPPGWKTIRMENRLFGPLRDWIPPVVGPSGWRTPRPGVPTVDQ
jgi:hypothetical protein